MKIDRSGWEPGPWDGEPDRVEWRSGEFGLEVRRKVQSGTLSGYLTMPRSHKWCFGNHPKYGDGDRMIHGRNAGGRYEVWFNTTYIHDWLPKGPNDGAYPDAEYRDVSWVTQRLLTLLHSAGGSSQINPKTGELINYVAIVDDTVRLIDPHEGREGLVLTGSGEWMLRQWVRFGDADIRIAADWIEDHPEFVVGMEPGEVSRVAQRLRSRG